MARRRKPELTFQQHIADLPDPCAQYGALEQTDITDTEHFIAEDHLLGVSQSHPGPNAQKADR